MALPLLADSFDEPPGSPNHTGLRESAWMGGELAEGRYYLSWATGVNEFRRSNDEFDADYREFVVRSWPASQSFLKSTYWRKFFLVLLRQRYRESKTGAEFPVPAETTEDRAIRMLMLDPTLTHAEVAASLETTEKQLQRMSTFQLAFRELSWNFVYPERTTKQSKR